MNKHLLRLGIPMALLSVNFLFTACNKNQNEALTEVTPEIPSQQSSYLKLNDAKELNSLIDKVSAMSDQQYADWKSDAGLRKTLYDRFVEVENKMLSNESKNVPDKDSSFFYFKDSLLYSKNGLMDRILNDVGVIQVGDLVIRYEGGNAYYAKGNSNNLALILSKDVTSQNLNSTFGNLQASGKTIPRATYSHSAPINSSNQQSFNFNVYNRRHDVSKRRHWINLNENYTIVPTLVSGSNVTWDIVYRFYMQFNQQKQVLFTWNTYPARTHGQYHFDNYLPRWNYYPGGLTSWFKDGAVGTLKDGGWEQCYTVGLDEVTYNIPPASASYPYPVGFPLNYQHGYGTVEATHPTYTVYRSNQTSNIPTNGNIGSSISLRSALIRFQIWSKVSDVGNQFYDSYYNDTF